VTADFRISWVSRRSGRLNDKKRQVLEMQQKTQARLAETRARLAQGMSDAKKVREDLEYTQKQMR
jgi:hypothetical protein